MSINKSVRLRSRYRLAGIGFVCIGLVALILGGPSGDQAARYTWQHWHAPYLALILDRSDATLAMEIGDDYFGTVVLGEATPQYDTSLAERAFDKALAIQPGILWAHYELSRIAFARGDFKGALDEINAELAANPENLRSLYVRGLIYGYRGQPGDLALAEADFRRFNAWAPTEWAGYNDLSWILEKEGKDADAEQVLEAGIAQAQGGETNPWLWNELGVARLNVGDRSGAAKAFQTALANAKKLTLADWYAAYTGDDPAADQQGLSGFIAGIQTNLANTASALQ